jgi:hypothetical protein
MCLVFRLQESEDLGVTVARVGGDKDGELLQVDEDVVVVAVTPMAEEAGDAELVPPADLAAPSEAAPLRDSNGDEKDSVSAGASSPRGKGSLGSSSDRLIYD